MSSFTANPSSTKSSQLANGVSVAGLRTFLRLLGEERLAVDFEGSQDTEQDVEAGPVFPLLEPDQIGLVDAGRGGEILERQPPVLAQTAEAPADQLHGARAMPRNHRNWPEYTDQLQSGQ